jgi:DNA modification methylase
MGSGSTGKAAALEGFSFIGIEQDPEFVEIAAARIDAVCKGKTVKCEPITTPEMPSEKNQLDMFSL